MKQIKIGQHFSTLGKGLFIHWALGLYLRRVKLYGCEADYSPTTSAQVKNDKSYNSTSPYVLVYYRLINQAGGLHRNEM
jgi:hypothetical protein